MNRFQAKRKKTVMSNFHNTSLDHIYIKVGFELGLMFIMQTCPCVMRKLLKAVKIIILDEKRRYFS